MVKATVCIFFAIFYYSYSYEYSDTINDFIIVKVRDGDTFVINIENVPDVFGKEIAVRIRGIDTPELNDSREEIRNIAIKAKEELEKLFNSGNKIILYNLGRDKYFRLLASVKVGGIDVAEYQGAIYAKLVDKVGDRKYWEQWSKDIANIAITYTKRINDLISKEGEHKKEFYKFLSSLQQNINPTIDRDNAIEMISQHLITQPVFEALFENYSFVNSNPVSKSMANMIKLLENQAFSKELKDLEKFYQSIKMRASGIDNAEGKQKIIFEFYDKFFKTAFPKMVEKLGIVYTPLECVDFIVKSINVILKEEFESDISDKNVKIIDPFVGTGTFMTRLMKNIEKEKLEYKYKNELYANEIILLAYYIASINIENTYHDIMGGEYKSFEGISLTDTFQLNEDNDKDYKNNTPLFPFFTENIERINKQLEAPIKVIMANPPYSIWQKSANKDAQNTSYPNLQNRISNTYVK